MEQTVQDVMTREVVTVTERTSYRDAVRLVAKERVDALPVVGDDGRLVGVVTVGDLLLKEEATEGPFGPLWRRMSASRRAAATTVGDCMSRAVVVEPGASLCAASRLMHRHRSGGLTVVDADGRVAGIVTRSDLLKVFLHEDSEVCAAVQEALGPLAGRITCDVTDGRVHLAGHVPLRSDVERAVAAVRRLPAVVDVDEHVASDVDDVTAGLVAL